MNDRISVEPGGHDEGPVAGVADGLFGVQTWCRVLRRGFRSGSLYWGGMNSGRPSAAMRTSQSPW